MSVQLRKRIITAIVAGSLALFLIQFLWGFTILLALLVFLSLYEIVGLLQRAALPRWLVFLVTFFQLWFAFRIYVQTQIEWTSSMSYVLAAILSVWYTLAGLYALWRMPFRRWWEYLFLTVVYPVASLALVYAYFTADRIMDLRPLIGVLMITWASDSAQYFIGRRWGNHRLAPSISPGKTMEGFLGAWVGILPAVGITVGWLIPQASWAEWLGVGMIVWLWGTLGDLFESSLKRSVGVKDSGKLLPGHGGILDRLDSLFFCMPVIIWWWQSYGAQ